MIAPRLSICIAPAIAGLLAAITGVHLLSTTKPAAVWSNITNIEAYLQHAGLPANTKFYSLPNSHLTLSFYTGLPFQSIYAIRKTFLDTYPGEIVYVDIDGFRLEDRNRLLAPDRLREAAVQAGEALDEACAQVLSRRVRTWRYRQSVNLRIGGVLAASAEPLPGYAEQLLKRQNAGDAAQLSEAVALTPVLRGYQITNLYDWVGFFMYRFVDPKYRMGPALNYAERLRGSRADILTETGWIVYRSPHDRDRRAGVTFRLLE